MAAKKTKSRKPDYVLKCLHKPTESRGRVGAAWLNTDGTIRIIFDPWVTIRTTEDVVLTLFPAAMAFPAKEGEASAVPPLVPSFTPPSLVMPGPARRPPRDAET